MTSLRSSLGNLYNDKLRLFYTEKLQPFVRENTWVPTTASLFIGGYLLPKLFGQQTDHGRTITDILKTVARMEATMAANTKETHAMIGKMERTLRSRLARPEA